MTPRLRSPLPVALLALAAAATLPQAARADASPADASSPVTSGNHPPHEFHPLAGALVTGTLSGNDSTFTNPDGSAATGNLGGHFEVFGGAEFPLTQGGLRLRITAGFHQGSLSTPAGGEQVHEIPLEASLVYPVNDALRIGAGAHYAMHTRFTGPGGNTSDSLNSTPGVMAFAEYAVAPHVWLDLRYVSEYFEAPDGSSINTGHWGLGAVAEY